MYSKIKLFGHPIHPMLVGFPVAFYTGALVSFIAYQSCTHIFWYKVGLVSNGAGVATAALAAIFGFIDWLGIPSVKGAKKSGIYHMVANVAALLCFGANVFIQMPHCHDLRPDATLAIVLCAIGFALTLVAGFLGWALVQKHHVGVALTDEQQRLEPMDGVKN